MIKRLIGKTLLLAALCLASASCTGSGDDNENQGGAVFKATVSPTTISADGVDAAVFDVRFRGTKLTADEVTFYNADDNTVVEMPDMKFTTTDPGTYSFYVKYANLAPQEGEEAEYTSAVLRINAVDGAVSDDEIDLEPNGESGLTMSVSATVVQAGVDQAIFVIRYDGEVLKEGYTIYDADTNRSITLPTVTKTSASGKEYELPYYQATKSEVRSFWVAYKTSNTLKNPISITAVDFAIPTRPADPQPGSTSFKRRSMITQFTGLGCGYCPFMIAALHDVLADETYGSKAELAAVHTYSGDPYAPAENVDGAFGITGYPTVVFDMATIVQNYNYATNMSNIKKAIDNSLSTPAKAGISVRADVDGNTLVARVTVKAAEEGSFRVGAWVLEDGLTGNQSNYGMDDNGYNFNTHNNVLRKADSDRTSSFRGYDLGTVKAGEMADHVFVITLDSSWKKDNCHMMYFVTALDGSSYRVTNVIGTNSLTEAVSFEYE
ncbi:Omp28-related outer membrane protein [uncultured Alistipes sp.]|uniref:Omp28-related outer membrane protein n=1 Tax=uncultured Alistipes sp. TaxID=538949 RepID=UPI002605DAB5|nr:Omp28-related outer membrane protein [uncultured Alistipes sp.]